MKYDLQKLFEKSPPCSIEAEKNLLGSMLLGGRTEMLEAQDFSHPGHAAIFECLEKVINEHGTHDIGVLAQRMDDLGILEQCGGREYLVELHEIVPSSASVGHYEKKIYELSSKRLAIEAAGMILYDSYNNTHLSSDEVLSRAMERLKKISSHDGEKKVTQVVVDRSHAESIYALTPAEILSIYHSLKNPTDKEKVGLKLSDPCALLLAYAIAGSLSSKRIVVKNDFMQSKDEWFYTNHYVLFVNRSGAGKTGSAGVINEFVENFNRTNEGQKLRLKSNMASGPKGLIMETYGTHKHRIKERTICTGPVLPPLSTARKDAPPRYAETQEDVDRATTAYTDELYSQRDNVKPIIFSIDELAEKMGGMTKLSNDTLINIHTSGPTTKFGVTTYNDIGTCYGYGHAVSIFGNIQLALVAEMLYNSKNSASGLLGRMLPLSNGFQSDIKLPESEGSQEAAAAHFARIVGSLGVNSRTARFTGLANPDFVARFSRPNGIEPEKIFVMAQRLIAPAALFGADIDLIFVHMCELLAQLYEDAYTTAEVARATTDGNRATIRIRVVLDGLVERSEVGDKISLRDTEKAITSNLRDGCRQDIMDYFFALKNWRPYSGKSSPIAGFVRTK